jgi:hypothetical protein
MRKEARREERAGNSRGCRPRDEPRKMANVSTYFFRPMAHPSGDINRRAHCKVTWDSEDRCYFPCRASRNRGRHFAARHNVLSAQAEQSKPVKKVSDVAESFVCATVTDDRFSSTFKPLLIQIESDDSQRSSAAHCLKTSTAV